MLFFDILLTITGTFFMDFQNYWTIDKNDFKHRFYGFAHYQKIIS